MTIKINYFGKKTETNYAIFCDDKLTLKAVRKDIPLATGNLINQFVSSIKNSKKNTIIFSINPKQKIILIKINSKSTSNDIENKGAEFYKIIKSEAIESVCLLQNNIKEFSQKNKNFLNEFLHGLRLKSYQFNKYKTNTKNKDLNILLPKIFKKQLDKKN